MESYQTRCMAKKVWSTCVHLNLYTKNKFVFSVDGFLPNYSDWFTKNKIMPWTFGSELKKFALVSSILIAFLKKYNQDWAYLEN